MSANKKGKSQSLGTSSMSTNAAISNSKTVNDNSTNESARSLPPPINMINMSVQQDYLSTLVWDDEFLQKHNKQRESIKQTWNRRQKLCKIMAFFSHNMNKVPTNNAISDYHQQSTSTSSFDDRTYDEIPFEKPASFNKNKMKEGQDLTPYHIYVFPTAYDDLFNAGIQFGKCFYFNF